MDEPVATTTSTTTETAHSKAALAALLHQHEIGQKCDMCDAVAPWQFAGGALSFDEYDRFQAAAMVEDAVNDQMSVFYALTDNIRSSDLSALEKAASIRNLASSIEARLAAADAAATAMAADQQDARADDDSAEESGMAARRDAVTTDRGSMSAFKDLTGSWRWIALHSNKYMDREGEIFTEAAHKAFVAEVRAKQAYPTLRLFHIPYDIGVSDFIDYADGFVVSSGKFSPGMEDIAERLAATKDLGCSHGYLFRRENFRDGVYHAYRSYEISVLPRSAAANTLTAYFAGEEVPMLSEDAKAFFESVAGEQRTAVLEQGLEQLKAFADSNGLTYKSIEAGLSEQRSGTKEDEVEQPDAAAAAATEETPPEAVGDAAPPEGDPVETPTPDEQEQAAEGMAAGEPVADEKAMINAFKAAVGEAVAPVLAELAGLKDTVVAQAATIAELQRTKDESMADMIRPRVGPPSNGTPQSAAAGNVLDEATAEAIKAMGEPAAEPTSPVAPMIQDLMALSGRRAAINGAY